jgi:hypothetical protein
MARFRAHRAEGARVPLEPVPERAHDDLRSLALAVAGGASEPMGLYAFRTGQPGAALALGVEEQAFAEALGADAALVVAEQFAPYDHATLLFCVLDHRRGVPAAMLRLILPSTRGLKTLNDLPGTWGVTADQLFEAEDFDYDPNHTWDLATLAIGPEYRAAAFQGTITLALIEALSVLGARLGFGFTLSVLHVPVLRMLQWKLHRPFHDFEGVEPRPYLDSPASLPAWMHLKEWHRRLAERDPVLARIMTEGVGLQEAVASPDWDQAAELAAEVSALADLRLHLR